MAIKVASNFEVGTGLPIDSRYVFESVAERDAIEPGRLYEGLVTFVKATQRRYIYDGLKWRDITDRHYVLDLTGATDENVDNYRLNLGSIFAYNAKDSYETSTMLPYKITVIGKHNLSAAETVIAYDGGYDFNPAEGTKLIIENLSSGIIHCGTVTESRVQISPESAAILTKDGGDTSTWTKTGGYSLADDADKPVSTAQQTAIDNAKKEAVDEAKKSALYKGTISDARDFVSVLEANAWQKDWTWKISAPFKENTLYRNAPKLEAGDVMLATANHPENAIADSDPTTIERFFKIIKADVTYTNANPTTAAIGGIPKGTTFKDKSYAEMFQMLLYPYVKPSISLSSSTGKVFEKGTTLTAEMNVNVTAGSKALTLVGLYNGATSLKALEAKAGSQSASISITATTTVTAKAGDGDNTATSGGVTFTAVDPFYVGVVSEAPKTSDAVKALSKKVEAKGKKEIAHTTTASAGKYCFCYPKSHGALKTVLDTNGFDNTSDYDVSTVSVETAAHETVEYYVYTYKNVVVPGTMTMTYDF